MNSLEIATRFIEHMMDMRDSRISHIGVGCGMVIYESNGEPSNPIRMNFRDVVEFVLSKHREG